VNEVIRHATDSSPTLSIGSLSESLPEKYDPRNPPTPKMARFRLRLKSLSVESSGRKIKS
jgi:hypothetical protein